MTFKFSLTQRFTFTTIAILMVVSIVHFTVYKSLYSKNTEHLVKSLQVNTEQSLQNQLSRRGTGLGTVLSNNLFDAMYNYNIELVYQLMKPVLATEEVQTLHVVDKEALIFHDGKKHLLLLGEVHPRTDLLLAAMRGNKELREFTPQGIIFAIPISASNDVVGAIYMELSMDKLSKDINKQYNAIEAIRNLDKQRFFLIQMTLSIVLMFLASLVILFFVRNLNKPLNHLINELLNNNGKYEFLTLTGSSRSDEIGQLTRAYNEMGIKVNKHTAMIQKMAYHDSLTHLPNRNKFSTHIQALMQRDDIKTIHLFFIDLDGFKATNDNFGHATGDAMLITVAKRLEELVKFHSALNSGATAFDNNMVARIGGDEFLIAVINSDEDKAFALGDAVINSLHCYLNLGGNQVVVSGSVGISCYPHFAIDSETLIKQADNAMYDAKSQGKNGYSLFSQKMKSDAEYKEKIEQEIKEALTDLSQFELWYQPKVDLNTKKLMGAEALVRWKHPMHGYILPEAFIPVAEKSDMIIHIGEALLLQLAGQLGQWQTLNKINDEFNVSLNISVCQIYQKNIIKVLKDAIRNNSLSPHRIQFEVTESLLLSDKDLVDEVFASLQGMGVVMWLDDFGTGYSSLSYLHDFCFDGVKIDKSFIQGIESKKKNQHLVKAIISLVNTLGIELMVEGIETEEQANILQSFGCKSGQGYYYAKALPVKQFEEQWLCQKNG